MRPLVSLFLFLRRENMKKLLTLLLTLICILLLCGCSNSKDDANLQEWEKQLGQKGIISVGISPDYPPFESYDSSNNLIGFDVELFTNVIDELNKINGTDYEVEFVPMEFDTIISAIQTGQVDYGCSGFTYDEDRVGSVLFSEKYLASSIVAVTSNNNDINSLSDLNNKIIAAQSGTTCAEAASTYTENVELLKDVNVMMEAFKAGAYDAVFLDEPVAKNYENGDSVVILSEKVEDNDTYIVCSIDHDLLNEKISEAITSYINTDSYNELVNKWGVK